MAAYPERSERSLVEVEGIGVLHDELAGAHHAEARPHLVAELGLDLVKVDRQLAVAAQLAPGDIGDHLFVRGSKDELPLVAILQAQQLGPVFGPAVRLLPQLGGLNRRHQDLQRPGPVHFLAHDVFDLAQHPQPQGQPAVDAGGDTPDQAGAQHQLVAEDLRLGGSFLGGGDRILGKSHAGRVAGEFAGNPSR